VVKEGAHWEGSVVMTHEGARPARPEPSQGAQASQGSQKAPQPVAAGASSGQGSIFSKQDRESASGGDRQATGPGNNGQ
jgi:hypothetical protein